MHFGTQESCAWQVLYKGFCGTSKFCELLAPKCTLEHLGTHWGPSRPASRLWPWPVATALGLGRAGAEEGWGWAGQGLRRATGQPQPPSQPRSQPPSAADGPAAGSAARPNGLGRAARRVGVGGSQPARQPRTAGRRGGLVITAAVVVAGARDLHGRGAVLVGSANGSAGSCGGCLWSRLLLWLLLLLPWCDVV